MNRLMNQMLRRVVNMAVREGIDAGARMMAGPGDGQPPSKEQKAAIQRAGKSARMLKRIVRF